MITKPTLELVDRIEKYLNTLKGVLVEADTSRPEWIELEDTVVNLRADLIVADLT